MTAAEAQRLPGNGPVGADLLLWGSAALAALGVHAGLVAWVLRSPPVLLAEAAAPVAVMLELAPDPVSPELAEPEVSPDMFDAPEIARSQPAPPPTPAMAAPLDPPPPLPVPDAPADPVADAAPVIEMPPAPPAPAGVAVARPQARPADLPRVQPPQPARPPRPQPERVERRPNPEPPSQAARTAAAEAPPAPTAAASQTSRGASGSVTPAAWQSRLMAHLERRKRYPAAARSRREQGVAHVRFSVDAAGNVLSVQLARSSGHPALDEEVIALVRRASPLPAPPPGAPRDITAPVQFRIR